MARNQNTFEKRRREMEKKLKAVEKRERRQRRKEAAAAESLGETAPATDAEVETSESDVA